MAIIFYAGAALASLLVLAALIWSGRFVRSLLFSAFTGNAALFTVSWLGTFTGATLVPGPFTVGVATVLGLPGVLGMLLLKLILA